MPVAFTSTSTSEAFGPSSSTSVTVSGLPFSNATAARVFISVVLLGVLVGTSSVGDRKGQAHRRERNPASVAMAAEVAASCRFPLTRPNDGGPALVWVPAPGPCEFHVEKKLQVSIEKHYTKKPD